MPNLNSSNDVNDQLLIPVNIKNGICLNDQKIITEGENNCGIKAGILKLDSLSNNAKEVNSIAPELNLRDIYSDLLEGQSDSWKLNTNKSILSSVSSQMLKDAEVKDSDNKQIIDSAELRKIDVVSEGLEKAGIHPKYIVHKPPNSSPNSSVPDSYFRKNGDLNLDDNSKIQVESDTKSKQIIHKGNVIQFKEALEKVYDPEDFTKKIKIEMSKFSPKYDADPDTICGIGCFKPQWLQQWATSRSYLGLYSILGILSGSYYSYLISSMSTLEKRFSFKSKISGLIMTVDEITPLFLGVLVGYFGGRAHRPRVVALGMLLSSLCCFVSALPYFIYGHATHLSVKSLLKNNDTDGLEVCGAGEVEEVDCDSDDRPPTLVPILILMFGSFLKGFGNLAYYAVGLAYMDDNSKQKNTPMYLAFAFALRLLGPLLGFLMSSVFLKFPENPFVDPGFGNDDPRWIGGWWMGFLLQGFLLAVCTVPMSMFPRRLPGHKQPKSNIILPDKKKTKSNVGNFFAVVKRLTKNPLLIFITLNVIFSTMGTFGHYIMLPKYMENQFKLSASEASLASGPPGLVAAVTSILLGGFTIYRLRPSAKVLTAGMVALEVATAIGFLMLMIPHCEVTEMANYGMDDNGLLLSRECNANCSCSTSKFTPVCSPDGNTLFFSHCYAGCTVTGNQEFGGCSCVLDESGLGRKTVTEGFCVSKDCWPQALTYIISFPILQCIVSFLKAAYTMILLRSIDPQDKSVALGIFETMISAFGFIPFPMVFGSLADSACLVWETTCGKTGNCWFYDVSKFNYLLHGASALFSSLSASCLFVVYLLSARLRNLYEEEEGVGEETDTKPPEKEEVEELDMVTRF